MWKKIFGGSKQPAALETNPLYDKIDRTRLPRHVAIIMDGNGRWANGQGLVRTAGHRAGVASLKQVLKVAIDLKIEALTVYAFSTENWKRPHTEVDFLMGLFSEFLRKKSMKWMQTMYACSSLAGFPSFHLNFGNRRRRRRSAPGKTRAFVLMWQ